MSLIPYLTCDDSSAAIDFYVAVFDAVEEGPRFVDGSGRVGHAALKVGSATMYLSDEYPEMGVVSPATLGGHTSATVINVPDADATAALAVEHGATIQAEVSEQFHGARSGTLIDPWGHRWMVSTQVREVSDEELANAAEEFGKS